MSDDAFIDAFSRIGLTDKKTKEIIKNKKVSKSLFDIINEAPKPDSIYDDKTISLLHALAVECKGADVPNRHLVTNAIVDGRLKSNLQVSEAYKYVNSHPDANNSDMEKHSGVGVEVTEDDVRKHIGNYINENKQQIEAKRYAGVPALLGEVKKIPELKWAAPQLFKPIIDEKVLALLGPKDERDVVKKEKKKKEKAPAQKEKTEPVFFF